jgi:hypothetical protein
MTIEKLLEIIKRAESNLNMGADARAALVDLLRELRRELDAEPRAEKAERERDALAEQLREAHAAISYWKAQSSSDSRRGEGGS